MNRSDVKFLHIRRYEEGSTEPHLLGGLTIAYKENKKGTKIKVATARCSNRDPYYKKSGRNIAILRMERGEYDQFNMIPELPSGEIVKLLLKHNKINLHYPSTTHNGVTVVRVED
jgi:hypothetical protein